MQKIENTISGNEMKNESTGANAAGTAKGIQYTECPCCHSKTLVKPIKVNGDVLDEFLACTMTGEPFKHAYRLYGGKLVVVLQTAERDKMALLIRAVNALDRYTRGIFKQDTDDDLVLQGIKASLRVYSLIPSIGMTVKGEYRETQPALFMQQCCEDIIRDFDSLKPATEDDRAAVSKALMDLDVRISDPKHVYAVPVGVLEEMLQTHNNLYRLLLDSGFDENFWGGIELA